VVQEYQAPALIKINIESDQLFASYQNCFQIVTWVIQDGICDPNGPASPSIRMGAGTIDCYTRVM